MPTINIPNRSRTVDTENILCFLQKYKTQGSITSLVELEGLLVGWSCSSSSRAQDLLDNIYGEETPEIASMEEIERFLVALFSFQNLSIKKLNSHTYTPFFLKKEPDLKTWCRYFICGFADKLVPSQHMPERIIFYLMCIIAKSAPEDRTILDLPKEEFDFVEKMANSLKVKDFAGMAQEIYLFSCEQRENARSSQNKMPGRNDPCVCGSGKKFKKCCLQ